MKTDDDVTRLVATTLSRLELATVDAREDGADGLMICGALATILNKQAGLALGEKAATAWLTATFSDPGEGGEP